MIRRAVALYENLPLPAGSVVGVVAIVVLDRVRPTPLPGPRGLQRAAGAAALAAGCALNVWALRERRRRTTGEFQLEQPQSLVTTGPYALSRHPMYVGWWLIHLGVGVVRGSAWMVATLPVAVLVEHLGVLAEERGLGREFGDEFADYRERVPRYLAWSWRRMSAARPTS
ncbi:isoprenylcysteine carboxylmethyltransferase family protein [Agromyces sp. ISL-38]|uniref:methyltransferase family protein n=1 Tax=Agromyces sp. ISL-38 TaxID=2819107 RepID=UPI002034CABF|nr:isoprenylcysteine carboxylmethyltransferase family protein [Agromyces sp. ISL-38]